MFLMIFIDLEKALSNFTDSTSGDFWIGANDLVMSGNWSWTDKTSFDFTDWDKGQPQNVSDCGAVIMAHGKWITDDCIKQKAFICLVSSISTTPAASTLPVTTTMKSTSCPPSWTYYSTTGFCYMSFPNGTWLYGEDRCRVENAHLASVHSHEEALFLAGTVHTYL
uniref:C-type lectin domain-containing protein n=1 Tax=Panagrolaimus superbus TaxID=310955 RepID=A0A914XY14_9BILA